MAAAFMWTRCAGAHSQLSDITRCLLLSRRHSSSFSRHVRREQYFPVSSDSRAILGLS